MKRYLFVLHQDGGCDYTIECGTATFLCDADSLINAYKQVVEQYGIDGDFTYQDFGIEIDVYEISKQYNFADLKNEVKEYSQYLKLKDKFGNGEED